MSPGFFERLIVDLLIAMGYGGGRAEMVEATGGPGDRGIDGMIKEDALGLDVVYVQAKRYADGNAVGRSEVQGFAGSLDGVRATKGIFFSTSTFSQGARDYVGHISKRIVLIDGAELARLMVRHNVGVRTRTAYEVKRIDEDYFTEWRNGAMSSQGVRASAREGTILPHVAPMLETSPGAHRLPRRESSLRPTAPHGLVLAPARRRIPTLTREG